MLDYPVRYHGVELNTIENIGEGRHKGCMLEEFDFGNARGVGYTEKRAQDDGLDASDVYMGPRTINLTGIIYGADPGDLHDRLQDVRTAFTPTVSYDFDPFDYGYIPLEFSLPTNDLDDFPDGYRMMEFRARPLGQPAFSVRRDTGAQPGHQGVLPGGAQTKGVAIQWRATLECKDPRMYVRPDVWVEWNTPRTGAALVNRGDYPAPIDVLLVLGAASISTSKVEIDLGKSNMTIALGSVGPPAVGFPINTVFRYSSELKVLTVQEPSKAEALRMDLLTFRNKTTHPLVPPKNSTYSTRLYSATLTADTRFMYSESFA